MRSDSSGSPRAARTAFAADLHVHSRRSPACHLPAPPWERAAAGDPEALYRAARARGMGLFTLTDLHTIEGCLGLLERHPDAGDILISEEVEARDPGTGARPRVLLYGVNERQHRAILRLRGDVRDLLAYAREEGIAVSLGPFLGSLPVGDLPGDEERALLGRFNLFEVRHRALGRGHGRMMLRLVQEALGGRSFGATAGSGARSPRGVGRTATVSPARSRAEFVRDLREGRTWAAGEEGPAWSLAGRGLPGVRLYARVRRARRALDRIEIQRFQEKAKRYGAAEVAADPDRSRRDRTTAYDASRDPSRQWASP